MHRSNILNFQASTTILNAHTKKVWKLIVCSLYIYIYIYMCVCVCVCVCVFVCVCVYVSECIKISSKYQQKKNWRERQFEIKYMTSILTLHQNDFHVLSLSLYLSKPVLISQSSIVGYHIWYRLSARTRW